MKIVVCRYYVYNIGRIEAYVVECVKINDCLYYHNFEIEYFLLL